jgi:hypothetical protein
MSDDLKARLLKARLGEKTLTIEGVGDVRVRGLSRGEVLLLQKTSGNPTALEQKVVATGMVDPVMSEREVALWQKAATSAEVDQVVDAINRLSGLVQGAQKSDVQGTGDES